MGAHVFIYMPKSRDTQKPWQKKRDDYIVLGPRFALLTGSLGSRFHLEPSKGREVPKTKRECYEGVHAAVYPVIEDGTYWQLFA